jgi:hypothetical protein
MPKSHPRPWHRDSIFGEGFRHPLDRERRAQWGARVKMHRRAKRLTAEHADIAEYLPRFLGKDGRCDPTHQTLSDASGYCVNTVKEALKRLAACGLLTWARRLIRDGARVRQTSNAYMLTLGEPPRFPAVRCEVTTRPETPSESFIPTASLAEAAEAQATLARIRDQRKAAVEARLLGKGRAAATA